MMGYERRIKCDRGHTSGVVLGLLVAVAGCAFLLNHMGMIRLGNIWDLWPSAIAGLGIVKLFHTPISGGRVLVALAMIAVGVILQLNQLGLTDLDFNLIWPVLVMLGGFLIVWTSIRHKRQRQITFSENVLNKFIVFGGEEAKVTSQKFEGGSVSVMFGGLDLDLRQAEMVGEKVTIDMSATFGGVEVKVPPHWEVIVQGTPILGGFENSTRHRSDMDDGEKRVLMINGAVMLGGIEVTN